MKPFHLLAAAVLIVAAVAYVSGQDQAPSPKGGKVAEVVLASYADAIRFPVTIGQSTGWFILDTGSSHTVCNARMLANATRTNTLSKTSTLGNPVFIRQYQVGNFTIDKFDCDWIESVGHLNVDHAGVALGADVDGIIGRDVISRLQVRFRSDSRTCSLFIRDVFDPVPGTKIALHFNEDGTPLIDINIGAKQQAFALDTGCIASGELASEHAEQLEADGVVINTGMTAVVQAADGSSKRVELMRCKRFSIDSIEQADLIFSSSSHNILGWDFLSRYSWTLDLARKEMTILPGRRAGLRDRHDGLGMGTSIADDAKLVVSYLKPGSIAEDLGFALGDQIVAIDTVPISSVPRGAVFRLLAIPHSDDMIITTRRGSAQINRRISGG